MQFLVYLIISISIQTGENLNTVDSTGTYNGQTQSRIGQIVSIDHECHYPFNPSSIVTIILFQEKGVNYIAEGEERCSWHFAKEIETVIRDSIILPNFFKKKLLKKIREAKKRGKTI